ncbi:hypothetical protein AB205_0028210, partial [Aquarana catesbeiana]
MVDKFTSPHFLPQFIEMYRDLTCLWKVRSKDYSDRQKRKEAYTKLVELCTVVYAKADISYVTKKIANLRTIFKKELNKINESKRSGAGADEVYVPRLWYFESLRFLTDQEEARPSVSSLDSISENISGDEEDGTFNEMADSQDLFGSETQTVTSPPVSITKKRKTKQDATGNFLLQASAALYQKKDECDDLGAFAAKKMRRMSEDQKQLLEPLLIQLLNKGLRGELTTNTHLAEHKTTHPQSLQTTHPQSLQTTHPQSLQVPQQMHQWHVPFPQQDRQQSNWGHDYQYTSL